ncbi:hypothetical protein AB1285_24050 [Microbacterium sp. NRRL B-14842]|uniref:hypothetical protein n=1 Tax=Microbacterium sp. NRRL B-14842 TaxID=3162881 RepID=UPI003D2D4F71
MPSPPSRACGDLVELRLLGVQVGRPHGYRVVVRESFEAAERAPGVRVRGPRLRDRLLLEVGQRGEVGEQRPPGDPGRGERSEVCARRRPPCRYRPGVRAGPGPWPRCAARR